jgi:hypothetical protein
MGKRLHEKEVTSWQLLNVYLYSLFSVCIVQQQQQQQQQRRSAWIRLILFD